MNLEQQLFMMIKQSIEERNLEKACKIAEMVGNRDITNTNLQYALNVLGIFVAEKEQGVSVSFLDQMYSWEDIKNKYDEIKFVLRHAEKDTCKERVDDLIVRIKLGEISPLSVVSIINHTIVDKHAAARRVLPEMFE